MSTRKSRTERTTVQKLHSEQETADRYGLPRNRLALDRHHGKGLPYVRIGRTIRYDWDVIDKLLEEQAVWPQKTHAA
jgi:hypothetical protein